MQLAKVSFFPSHLQLDLNTEKGKEEAIRIIQKQIDRFRKGGDLSSMFPDRWLPTTFGWQR